MLEDFIERESAAGHRLVAAFVISTQGSTYRKPGAMMVFSESGRYSGLLSGGCLEGDLQAHASRLLESSANVSVHEYDSRTSDDPIWGLGLGCEGLMRILLLQLDQLGQPVRTLLCASRSGRTSACAISLTSGNAAVFPNEEPRADALLVDAARHRLALGDAGLDEQAQIFSLAVAAPPRVLLCGAGPDVHPVVDFACRLGWQVTIVDHRPAYVVPSRWPAKIDVRLTDLDAPLAGLDAASFAAAVVMSHHLTADGRYLGALADTAVPYIGLLGPPARRQRLLAEIPQADEKLRGRLRAPVGLDLGGRTPETIALAIVAEIQAALSDKVGGSFSEATGSAATSGTATSDA